MEKVSYIKLTRDKVPEWLKGSDFYENLDEFDDSDDSEVFEVREDSFKEYPSINDFKDWVLVFNTCNY